MLSRQCQSPSTFLLAVLLLVGTAGINHAQAPLPPLAFPQLLATSWLAYSKRKGGRSPPTKSEQRLQ